MMKKGVKKRVGVFVFMMLIAFVLKDTMALAITRDYTISASNPEYSKTEYTKKITFSGRKMKIQGKFKLKSGEKTISEKKKITIEVASNCSYYYGEGKISYSSLKKRIRKNNDNCYILFYVEVKNGKAVEIGLYA